MKTKFFTLFLIIFFIFSSACFATDELAVENLDDTDNVLSTNLSPNLLDYDMFITEDNYTLDNQVSGNIFAVSDAFCISNSGLINGNLFIVSQDVTLKSDVSYSNEISKDESYAIDSINSAATISGNVFAVTKNFTLEPGAQINGDLYIVAENINIDKSCVISGSVFAISQEITINGKILGSLYATSDNFSMSYFGSIAKDLNLKAEEVTLDSVIHRNANIDCSDFKTTSNFLIYGNLTVDAYDTSIAGEIDGNAKINSQSLTFNSDEKCIIKGDLNYSTLEELNIQDNIVYGNTTYSKYTQKANTNNIGESIKYFIIGLIDFVAFIFVVCILIKLVVPTYLDKEVNFSTKNILASFGLGLVSIFIAFILFIFLLLIGIGVNLAFALLFGYVFLLFISTPVFVLDIAKLLKEKLNIYALLAIIPAVLYLIKSIPVLGGIVMFLFFTIGVGRMLINMFSKNN